MGPQAELDRFTAFIDYVRSLPTVALRLKAALDGFDQLLRERSELVTRMGADGAHFAPFAALVNMLDKHRGEFETAIVSGYVDGIGPSRQAFPGDLGYQVSDDERARMEDDPPTEAHRAGMTEEAWAALSEDERRQHRASFEPLPDGIDAIPSGPARLQAPPPG